MIVKRQKKFTHASDTGKVALIDFLRDKTPNINNIDSSELEVFRKGLDAIGKQAEERKATELPERFGEILSKMGLPDSVVSQVPHWHSQQRPEVQERYEKILKANECELTNACSSHVIAENERWWANRRVRERLRQEKGTSKKEFEKEKKKLEKLGLPVSMKLDPQEPSSYCVSTKEININPNDPRKTIYHEAGHAIDDIQGTRHPSYTLTDGYRSIETAANQLTGLGSEVAANFYGRDAMKRLGGSEKDLKEFDESIIDPLKTYQLDLTDPTHVVGQLYSGIGTWLYDNNDKVKRKKI